MSGKMAELASRLERLLGYLRQDPGNISLIIETSELGIQVGRGEEALIWLDRAIAGRPGESRLLSAKGNALLALGQPARAAALFEGLIQDCGPNPVLNFNLAHARLYEGRAAEALALLESVPPDERRHLPQFDLSYGRSAYQLQRYDEATAAVDRFLAANPGHAEALGIKSLLLLDMDRTGEALALAQELLQGARGGGEQWAPHLVVATLALFAQDQAAAELHFAKVVEQMPEAGRAWSGRGFAAMLRQDFILARQFLEKAVLHMPDHPGTWHGLAWTCILLGDLARANEAVECSMRLDRNFADNHGTKAVLEFMQGRRTEAELSMRKALKLNPAAPSGLYARSLLQEAAGDAAAADATVEKILGTMRAPNGASLLEMYRNRPRRAATGPRPPASRLH